MESKLQSLKVPELKAVLTKASLPATGVKADLIKRLLENPTATAHLNDNQQTETAPATDTTTSTSKPAEPTTSTTEPQASASAPTPAASTSIADVKPEPTAEEKHQLLIQELEKRKARAARFGTTDAEAEAKLERALKFGVTGDVGADTTLKVLDGGLDVNHKGKRKQATGTGTKNNGDANGNGKAEESKALPNKPEVKAGTGVKKVEETVSVMYEVETRLVGRLQVKRRLGKMIRIG